MRNSKSCKKLKRNFCVFFMVIGILIYFFGSSIKPGIVFILLGLLPYIINLIIKLIESIVNLVFSKYMFFKQRHNNKFINSVRSESGSKSIYFFNRLNEIIRENEKEEFIKSLDFINPYDRNIYQLELKRSIYIDNGKLDSDEIIKRNRMFLKIVMYMPLQELYEWETFLSINESPHFVKEYFRGIGYSSVIFSIFGSILSHINNAPLYIYCLFDGYIYFRFGINIF